MFKSGPFEGLMDPQGEIIIPPVYDALGWSDGSPYGDQEVLGYSENGKWGLLSLKNKKITPPVFNNLRPFQNLSFIASKKSGDSNHLFYGVLDEKGNTSISFSYFSIIGLNSELIKVGIYEDGKILYGIRNIFDEEVIPTIYRSIDLLDNILICEGAVGVAHLYNLKGQLLLDHWVEEIITHEKGYKIKSNGRVGMISSSLEVIHSPWLKEIAPSGNIMKIKEWEIYSLLGGGSHTLLGDSISIISNDLWIAHVNDAQHMLGASNQLTEHPQLELKNIHKGFVVARSKASGEWSLFKTDGTIVEAGFDSVLVDQDYFYCLKNDRWKTYDSFARVIGDTLYQEIGRSIYRHIPVKKNDYWGWVDFQGNQMAAFKFDQIQNGIEKQFIVKYVHGWGVSGFQENFLILPEFDSISIFENFYLATKGESTSIFTKDGDKVLKTGFNIESKDLLRLYEDQKVGLITDKGFTVYPDYEEVYQVDEYYVLKKDSTLEMIDGFGRKIVQSEDEIEEVFGYSEGYFHILKDGKHGFIDLNGKLRVANRYDGAKLFSEGFAAIKLRGNWGYINKWEELVIQPYYTDCSPFEGGLASAAIDGSYGIIDQNGNEIISFKMAEISRTENGNYLLESSTDKYGLADREGRIFLSTNYDEIIDTPHDLVIAKKGSSYGVLTYEGYSHLPFEYQNINIQGDYLILNR